MIGSVVQLRGKRKTQGLGEPRRARHLRCELKEALPLRAVQAKVRACNESLLTHAPSAPGALCPVLRVKRGSLMWRDNGGGCKHKEAERRCRGSQSARSKGGTAPQEMQETPMGRCYGSQPANHPTGGSSHHHTTGGYHLPVQSTIRRHRALATEGTLCSCFPATACVK